MNSTVSTTCDTTLATMPRSQSSLPVPWRSFEKMKTLSVYEVP